jgi:hypothetical protein
VPKKLVKERNAISEGSGTFVSEVDTTNGAKEFKEERHIPVNVSISDVP